MFHCHNLVHEDHDMMAAFNVSALPGMGYEDDHFQDPMESAYRAKKYSASDYSGRAGSFSDSNIKSTITTLAKANPYHL
jgi:bilirubin oxidase